MYLYRPRCPKCTTVMFKVRHEKLFQCRECWRIFEPSAYWLAQKQALDAEEKRHQQLWPQAGYFGNSNAGEDEQYQSWAYRK